MSCEQMSRRPRPCSPAAKTPLDDDDLLSEILLRLPPQPSSLPRASAVCPRWRLLVSDPRFLRRFRIHHRRNPPLLGFFAGYIDFKPVMDPPNRLPNGHFSLQQLDLGCDRVLGCRHGLVLIFLPKRLQVLVWDPVTDDQHHIAIPPGFAALDDHTRIHGAVLRTGGDVQHFQVVMVATVDESDMELVEEEEEEEEVHYARAVAQVYSSETGTWGDLISASLPPIEVPSSLRSPAAINREVPGVLVGDSLYWRYYGSLLKFDLYRQRLSAIDKPPTIYNHLSLMRADGGELGCIILSDFSAELWKWKTDCDGVGSWVLGRTIQLDKLLSLNPEKLHWPRILGFAEHNNVVVLWTDMSLFTVQLESLEFKKLFKTNLICHYYAFESVYTGGRVIGGGPDGAELLPKT